MYNGIVDPKVKAEMARSLNVWEKVARKVASKVATTQAVRNSNMITEDHNGLYEPVKPMTVPHSNGVQEGRFGMFAIPNESGKPRYDIADMATGSKIVGNIHLVECANAIVKLLSRGYSFYSPQISQLLEMEQQYVKNYQDCISFKKKYNDSPKKDSINETRFEEAKNNAVMIKEKLITFARKL